MATNPENFDPFRNKMEGAGLSSAAILAFQKNFESLAAGSSGLIPESDIEAVTSLPAYYTISKDSPDPALLAKTVVLKLNGGLGTSMGLEKAKSLLVIKDGKNFLDFIAEQILFLRSKHGKELRFLLMNSFSTSADTLEHLRKFPALGDPKDLELMQNFVPKIDATTFEPVSHPANPQLEWCPPGHGDIYPSMLGSGWLDRLLGDGCRYLFVSNSDNLGASLDVALLTYFARSGLSFLMEVCERTAADKKGGHLAKRGHKFLLRESAQCSESDAPHFQNIEKHRYFNTNNLWIRLDVLKKVLEESGGYIPLPMIKNAKTVDPRDKNSKPVFQLESAMGAAIESFPNTGAIVVARNRFAPVKTTSDLLALRSDAYEVTPDFRLELTAERRGNPPMLDLDGEHYRLVDQFEAALPDGAPSLKDCSQLKIKGPVILSSKNVFKGNVKISNPSGISKPLKAGLYENCETQV